MERSGLIKRLPCFKTNDFGECTNIPIILRREPETLPISWPVDDTDHVHSLILKTGPI